MKNIYDAPEFKVISLLTKAEICAGEEDNVNGGLDPDLTLSGFVVE